jgi:PAS domain S-box-containing protein
MTPPPISLEMRKSRSVLSRAEARVLRDKAETSLRQTRRQIREMPLDDVQKLIHELQVHEIELRMQNDELLRAQSEADSASERYSLLYNSAPCAYLTLTEDGRVVESNLAASSLLDVERGRLQRQKFTTFIAPDSQDAFYLFCRHLQRSTASHSTELELKVRHRPRLVVQATGFRAKIDKVHEFRLALTDITAREEAKEALQESERVLASFFQQAPVGIKWVGLDGVIFRANQAQLDLHGCTAKQYVGHSWSEFAVDHDVVTGLLHRLAAGETIHDFHETVKHCAGGIRHVLIDATPHLNQNGEVAYFSVFTRDITERKELEQQILEISDREQKRIAQDLHDDLGQILVASIYLTGMLAKRLDRSVPARAREASKILQLMERALSQTRILVRGLYPVRSELNGLMSALEELAARTTEVFGCNCVLSCPQHIDIRDEFVATHLFRIAQEAVTNAIKHGKARRIEIRLQRARNRLVLKISDNGSGLVRRETGMGLRIMQYRIAAIKGNWSIDPAPSGAGTIVTCSVPFTP